MQTRLRPRTQIAKVSKLQELEDLHRKAASMNDSWNKDSTRTRLVNELEEKGLSMIFKI